MPHFFVNPRNIDGDRIVISDDEAHHLINVRRVKAGDQLQVFDGTGRQYTVKINSISKENIHTSIISQKQMPPSRITLNVYQAIPKGDRADWLAEKYTELGVSSMIPMETERSIIRDISPQKLSRWERLSAAAAEQCLRPDLMKIGQPLGFEEVLKKLRKDSLNIIPWEAAENADSIKTRAGIKSRQYSECNILIGPEGGFAISEIEKAKDAGVIPVSLGSRILRVETAGLLAVVLALESFGEYGQ